VSHDTLQTAGYQSIRIFSGGITIIISYRGVHVSSKTPLDTASDTLNTSKACGQGGGLQDYDSAAQTCCPLTANRYSAR
jgi:hypothetical protein